jgi:DNA-binding NtrC family response regulator
MDVLRLNVLLLDEDPRLLDQMKEHLEEKGYSTSSAHSLNQANDLLEHSQFDVIVTDATMPDNDGVKLLKKLGSHIPVVMLSENQDTIVRSNIANSVCCFLDKADLDDRLAQAVWTAFKRFKIDRQLQRDSDLAA